MQASVDVCKQLSLFEPTKRNSTPVFGITIRASVLSSLRLDLCRDSYQIAIIIPDPQGYRREALESLLQAAPLPAASLFGGPPHPIRRVELDKALQAFSAYAVLVRMYIHASAWMKNLMFFRSLISGEQENGETGERSQEST